MSRLADHIAGQAKALKAIREERDRQIKLWGHINPHDYPTWIVILTKQVGQLAEHAMRGREWCFTASRDQDYFQAGTAGHLRHMRSELASIAAVAMAMIEQIDEDLIDANNCTRLESH